MFSLITLLAPFAALFLSQTTARVLPPSAGELLKYCGRPLSILLKVDERVFPGSRLVAGIGDLHGDEGPATHREGDEVVFVVEGTAEVTIGGAREALTLKPGMVAYIPQDVTHHLRASGRDRFRYLWVLGPRSSADSFRRAAAAGCDPAPAQNPASAPAPVTQQQGGYVMAPASGERLVYCEIPLTLTVTVDSTKTPSARLRAATGVLRKGEEIGTHRDADEVLYVIAGHGQAIMEQRREPIGPGSILFVPQGTSHGLINERDDPLEYIVVHSPQASADGFRRRASMPGPHCLKP